MNATCPHCSCRYRLEDGVRFECARHMAREHGWGLLIFEDRVYLVMNAAELLQCERDDWWKQGASPPEWEGP